nr:sporulation membrane protein YtaF [Desulfitobacterium hafniense]
THGQEKEQISQLQNLPHVTTLTSVIKIQLPSLGLVIQVLRSPDLADIDKSGCINLTESLLLGCALALDALAGGLGAGLSGMPLWVILIVAATQLFMISLGQTLTNIIKEGSLTKTKFLPGALLIILGFGKLM